MTVECQRRLVVGALAALVHKARRRGLGVSRGRALAGRHIGISRGRDLAGRRRHLRELDRGRDARATASHG